MIFRILYLIRITLPALLALCSVVSPLFGKNDIQSTGHSSEVPRQIREFSVLSYNIQSRPVLDSCSEKAPLIGKELRNYDLIGLQESFSHHQELFQAARPLRGVHFSQRRHFLKLVNSGLGVLTRFPILHSESQYFEEEGSLENRLGSKGVLMVRCRINQATLDFYTTHLAAGEGQAPIVSKQSELKQIIRFIRRHSPPWHAVILCGDFNMRLKDLTGLGKFGLRCAATELDCQKQTFIDHVFYRSSSALSLKPTRWNIIKKGFDFSPGKPLSDHAPVEVRFQILPAVH